MPGTRILLAPSLFIILTMTLFASEPDHLLRRDFGALLEPTGKVINGAGQDSGGQGFREFAEALGDSRYPSLFMTYTGLTPPVDDSSPWGTAGSIRNWGAELKKTLDDLGRPDVIPQIGLSMVGGRDSGAGRDGEVARGDFDHHIEALVEALTELARPAFIRIGYECEGSWNGYQPETYKEAFIRITRAIRAADLPVATVWCVAGGSSGTTEVDTLMPFYPGDEWVDWWSIDIFSADEIDAPLTAAFCETAGRHNKPVMIGETTPRYVGVLDGQASWDAWFGPFFALVRRQPEIKAISYINWDWEYWSNELGFSWHDWKDARIQNDPYVLKHYRSEMDSPLYLHSIRR